MAVGFCVFLFAASTDIQLRYCQGLIASALSHRQTVVPLMEATIPSSMASRAMSGMAKPRKRKSSFARQFTCKRLDLHHDFKGKNGSVSRALDDLEDRPSVVQKTAFAIY